MMSEEGKEDLQGIPNQEQTAPQAEMQPATPIDPAANNPIVSDASDPAASDPVASDPVAMKKKRTKILLLSTLIPAAAIILAAILVLVLVVLPEMDRASRYDAGMKAYQSGSYTTAVEAFAKLPAYKESAKYHELAAVYVLKQDGKYAEAKAEFTRLGLGDMATECDYLTALDLEKAGKNKEAYDAYLALKEYKDCKARATAIKDGETSKMLVQIKAIKAPATQQDFTAAVKLMDDIKKDSAKYEAGFQVTTAINSKTDELLPAYQKLYFEQVLAGKTEKNATFFTNFGMTASKKPWSNVKKLVVQKFTECPTIMGIYFKVGKTAKGKALNFRIDQMDYNEETQAYDTPKTILDVEKTLKGSNWKEGVDFWTLKGKNKGQDYDIRDLFPTGIYHMQIILKETKEVLASVYFTIGIN